MPIVLDDQSPHERTSVASDNVTAYPLPSASFHTRRHRRKALARPHNHRPPSARPSPLDLPPLHRLADPTLPALPLLPNLASALPVHMLLRSPRISPRPAG